MWMREIMAQTLISLMERDPDMALLDADLSSANGTGAVHRRFPERTFNVGIAEQNLVCVAAGLASYGFKPYITSFTPFATRRVCDQLAISVLYADLNVKVIGTDPGIAAELNGGTHMSMEDIGVLRSIPGSVIFEPSDGVELRLGLQAMHKYPRSVYMRTCRKELCDLHDPDTYSFDLLRADVMREGRDVTILSSGLMVREALEAAAQLSEEGVEAEVINVHTIKPLDTWTILASLQKTGCAVAAENHNVIGGLRSAVLEALADQLRVPVTAVGVEDTFGEVGPLSYLKERFGLNAQAVVRQARRAMDLKKNWRCIP